MRYSQALIPTFKEVPAEAEITSHRLMLRAGLMRKLASGTYTYLPAGWRTLLKIINIVRQEMNSSCAQEVLMPIVQPVELWQKSGRYIDYGETLGKFTDRHGRVNVLVPTAEEVSTDLAAGLINSYKQLPMNIYQINSKYRDEFRPRFGVLRSREFIMKDAYSFHADAECLEKTYRIMYDTYCRIFQRCGLEYVIVEAESGEMGGSGSHQFTVPCDNGEDMIVYLKDGSYAANMERAAVDPAPLPETRPNVGPTEEVHTPNIGTIEELAKFFKKKPKDMIKTLIYSTEEKTVAVVLRGDHDANNEKITQAVSGKHIELADEETIAKVTGAATGFAGPIGLAGKVDLMLIDHSVAAMIAGIAGANKTDYHISGVVPGRDFPLEGDNIQLIDIRNAVEGDTHNGQPLLFRRGIEVGQVFKLGTKYSTKLDATFLDADGSEKPCLMGCYGIGINRIMASAIELASDRNGIVWPISIAPWEVIVTIAGHSEEVAAASEKIYAQLLEKGIEVLLDDRDARPGVKFKDADLIGIPVRVTIGQKSLADDNVEIKLRAEETTRKTKLDTAADEVVKIVTTLKEKLNVGS